MYKFAVCDDEAIVRDQIVLFLQHLEGEQREPFQISCFSSGEDLLEHMEPDTQILLLDIRMETLSGIDTARRLRQQYPDLCIIFITTMGQYALEGYDVHAFGFLVKPLQYDSFARQVRDAMGLLRQHAGSKLVLKRPDQVVVYQLNDIIYFEIYKHDLKVVTARDCQEFAVAMKDMERQVEGQGFFRCHKSYLINLYHVQKIGLTSITMSNGDEIALSKHRRSEFMFQFNQCMRGKAL